MIHSPLMQYIRHFLLHIPPPSFFFFFLNIIFPFLFKILTVTCNLLWSSGINWCPWAALATLIYFDDQPSPWSTIVADYRASFDLTVSTNRIQRLNLPLRENAQFIHQNNFDWWRHSAVIFLSLVPMYFHQVSWTSFFVIRCRSTMP